MNRGMIALRNSSVSLLTQIITVLLQFVTRSVFIRYLGVEALGLTSTFASLLNTLSLAELGFHTAVIYNLYAPLAEKDEKSISKIVSIYRLLYQAIGIFFIAAAFCCLPLLPYILKGVEVTGFVRCVFLIQATISASTYFLAYKRSILYADQQGHLANLTDILVSILSNIIQVLLIIWLRSYIVYLLVRLAETIAGNLIVHRMCSKKYPYLHKEPVDRGILQRIVRQVKDIFASKLAGYVYYSTDSLVISAFVGTVQVGYLNNYVIISKSIRLLVGSITGPITPIIGNLLAENKSEQSQISVFHIYTFVRFLLAGLAVAPIVTLSDTFITMWIGADYRMDAWIPILLAADLYIHIIYSACIDYISGSGLFTFDRKVSVLGAGTNLITSLLMVNYLGVAGVLVGTVISQMVFWICRSNGVFRYCFHQGKMAYLAYWGKQLYCVAVFVVVCLIQGAVYSAIQIPNLLIRFLAGGVMCEILFLIAVFLLCSWLPEARHLMVFVKKTIASRFHLHSSWKRKHE